MDPPTDTRQVIVELNGHSLHEARICAARFLERTGVRDEIRPRKHRRSARVAKLERQRTKILRVGTAKMRSAILDAMATMRRDVLERSHIREASIADIVARVMNTIEFLTPQALAAAIAEIQAELVQSGIESASSEVGITWDQPPQAALDALYATTLQFARNIVDREKVAMKLALLAGMDAGDSIPDMVQRIKDVFDDGVHIIGPDGQVARVLPEDSWAEMVARTETTRAMTAGIMATYTHAGVQSVQWLAAEDERTCVYCEDADGLTALVGQPFESVEVDAPPAHPSCRCVVVSVSDADAAE
jgi:SPP1 gp7 family putative phage head morphogenesis protein